MASSQHRAVHANQNSADAHTAQPALAGRRVLISGGSTGIGRAIAVLLASAGARVFICGRNQHHVEDGLARIREVGEADGISVDLAHAEGVDRFVQAAVGFLGGIDIAVINAAVAAGGLEETSPADLRYAVDTNLTGIIATAHAVAGRMTAGGDILFVGSVSAEARSPESTVYAATKAGVQAFAEALRKELAERDIKVGNIEPGLTGSDMQSPETPPDQQREQIAAQTMMRAEDIAVAAQYMLTQPRRANVSLLRIEPRLSGG